MYDVLIYVYLAQKSAIRHVAPPLLILLKAVLLSREAGNMKFIILCLVRKTYYFNNVCINKLYNNIWRLSFCFWLRFNVDICILYKQGVSIHEPCLLEVIDKACPEIIKKLLPSLPATEKVKIFLGLFSSFLKAVKWF